MGFIFAILWVLVFLWTLYTARKNNRSMIIWGLVALVFSPVISLVCLFLVGKGYGN